MSLPPGVRSKLEAFVSQPIDMMTVPRRDLSINQDGLSAAFRVAYRPIRGIICPTLDLAYFNVEEAYQRQGYLRDTLTLLENNPQRLPVYIESMFDPNLIPMYERRGYIICDDYACGRFGIVDLFYQPQ